MEDMDNEENSGSSAVDPALDPEACRDSEAVLTEDAVIESDASGEADADREEVGGEGDGAAEEPATDAVFRETGASSPDNDTEESADGRPEDDADTEEAAVEEGDEAAALPVASVVEALLFAAREPLKLAHISRAVGKGTRQEAVRAAIDELNVHYLETGRAFEIAEVSGRFQLMSRPEYVNHIRRIYPKREIAEKDKSSRLTPAALDTLAIIAYKQPVTRGEIEHVRGVGCGPVLRALIERGAVRVVGKKADVVGQPLVYGTTEAFLTEFGLGSLDELPLRNEFMGFMGEPAGEPASELHIVVDAPAESDEIDAAEPAVDEESITEPEAAAMVDDDAEKEADDGGDDEGISPLAVEE